MDDDAIEETSGSGNMIALSLAVLGVVLGAAGLYFGLTANTRLGAVNESMAAGSDSAVQLEKQLENMSTQVAELSAMVKEQGDALARQRAYGNSSERAIKQLASDLRENREQIVKLTDQVVELGTRSVQSVATNTSGTATSSNTAGSSGSSSDMEGVYTIESGDTFARVASKTGVSLQALLDANPGVDPRRLRIGQQINLPAN